MAYIIMNYELAMAAGKDLANRRTAKSGRSKWNRADYNAAIAESARLLDSVGCSCHQRNCICRAGFWEAKVHAR